jgi:hypothetical protein
VISIYLEEVHYALTSMAVRRAPQAKPLGCIRRTGFMVH